jgi:hypothetical protein
MPPKKKPAKCDKVEAAIQQIKDRYRIGLKIMKKCGKFSAPNAIKAEAEYYGINRDTAQKLRAMAAKETGYSQTELNRLYKKFRKAKHALQITHFVKLLSVRKGELREELTDLALKHRWSSHRLQAEILARQGRRRVGGRRPAAADKNNIEAELARNLWAWDRWIVTQKDAIESLRPELQKLVGKLSKRIRKIKAGLEAGMTETE